MHHNGSGPQGFLYQRRYIWIDYPDALPEEPEPAPEPGVDPDDKPAPRFVPNPAYGPWTDEAGVCHPGFAVRVMANPTGAEARAERDAWATATRVSTRTEEYRAAEAAYLQTIAGRVREWRAYAADEDGAIAPIPAPGEVPLAENPEQWRAFYAIPEDLMYWVVGQIRIAHLLRDPAPKAETTTETASTSSTAPGATVTPTPAATTPAPTPPRS